MAIAARLSSLGLVAIAVAGVGTARSSGGGQPAGPAVAAGTGDAVIRAAAGGSEMVITTTARVAGAIHSLTWGGREFVDSLDHGRQIQSASNLDVDGRMFDEAFNPTEAGCERDMAGPASTSRVLWFSAGGRDIASINRMAFWLRPGQSSGGRPALNTTALSNHVLIKHVHLGCPQLPPPARDHAIRFDLAFLLPADERHRRAAFEALTGYMPAAFDRFFGLGGDGRLQPLSDGPGEQPLPVVVSTADGGHAMGVWSGDRCHTSGSPPGYGRFRFTDAGVTKWNVVFREHDEEGLRSGSWRYRVWVAVGTRDIVERVLVQLQGCGEAIAE